MVVPWFDPGVMNGWCIFDEQGNELEMGQVSLDDLSLFLDNDPRFTSPTLVGYEGYTIFRKKAMAHTGSKVPTAQAIGIIKSYAQRKGVKLVEQPSSILKTAQMLTGVALPSDHSISHQFAAFNHGAYYFIEKGLRKTALEMKHGKT